MIDENEETGGEELWEEHEDTITREMRSYSGLEVSQEVDLQDWRDLFRMLELSLCGRKIILAATGVFVSLVLLMVLGPIARPLGQAGLAMGLLFTMVMVTFIVREDLAGRSEGALAALPGFLRTHWVTTALTPLAFVGIVFFLAGAEALVTWIPVVGDFFAGPGFVILFVMSLMVLVVGLLFLLGSFVYPSIIVEEELSFSEVVARVYDMFRTRGVLLLLYEAIVFIVGVGLSAVAWGVSAGAVELTLGICRRTMGKVKVEIPGVEQAAEIDRIDQVIAGIPMFIQVNVIDTVSNAFETVGGLVAGIPVISPFSTALQYVVGVLQRLSPGTPVVDGMVASEAPVVGFFLGASVALIFILLVGFSLTLIASGGSIIYRLVASGERER